MVFDATQLYRVLACVLDYLDERFRHITTIQTDNHGRLRKVWGNQRHLDPKFRSERHIAFGVFFQAFFVHTFDNMTSDTFQRLHWIGYINMLFSNNYCSYPATIQDTFNKWVVLDSHYWDTRVNKYMCDLIRTKDTVYEIAIREDAFLTTEDMYYLCEALKHTQGVRVLILENPSACDTFHIWVPYLIEAIQQNTSLKEISVQLDTKCTYNTDVFHTLVSAVRNQTNIVKYRLNEFRTP